MTREGGRRTRERGLKQQGAIIQAISGREWQNLRDLLNLRFSRKEGWTDQQMGRCSGNYGMLGICCKHTAEKQKREVACLCITVHNTSVCNRGWDWMEYNGLLSAEHLSLTHTQWTALICFCDKYRFSWNRTRILGDILKGYLFLHPKMEILSLITRLLVVPHP